MSPSVPRAVLAAVLGVIAPACARVDPADAVEEHLGVSA